MLRVRLDLWVAARLTAAAWRRNVLGRPLRLAATHDRYTATRTP